MTYMSQMVASLPDQRARARRKMKVHAFSFVVAFTIMCYLQVWWTATGNVSPLWLRMVLSVIYGVWMVKDLWFIGKWEGEKFATEATMEVVKRGERQG